MMKFAVNYDGPIAIRYPRGEAYDGLEEYRAPVLKGRSEMIRGKFYCFTSNRKYVGKDRL